jgi:hypothetical protein
MKCESKSCGREVHNARIINGQTICFDCVPFHMKQFDRNGLRRLSYNPYNPKETLAYKEELESRYVPPGQMEWERWRPGRRTYI